MCCQNRQNNCLPVFQETVLDPNNPFELINYPFETENVSTATDKDEEKIDVKLTGIQMQSLDFKPSTLNNSN